MAACVGMCSWGSARAKIVNTSLQRVQHVVAGGSDAGWWWRVDTWVIIAQHHYIIVRHHTSSSYPIIIPRHDPPDKTRWGGWGGVHDVKAGEGDREAITENK